MTIISREHKFIYLAAPKTGSCSVEKALEKYNDLTLKTLHNKHAPYWEVASLIPNIEEYFVFFFVRNPWDLMVSKYFFHKAAGYSNIKGINVCSAAKSMSFREWVRVEKYRDLVYEYPIRNYYDFKYYGAKPTKAPRVFHIYKFEEMSHCLNVAHRAGALPDKVEIPHINKTNIRPSMHYSEHYKDDNGNYDLVAVESVAEQYKWCIRLRSYEFNRDGKRD